MARRSRKSRGQKSPVAADEPKASSSSFTSKLQRKKSASEEKSGSRMETRSSTAKKAKVNETDNVKTKATAKCNNNDGTGHKALEIPTKKSRNSRSLESPSTSAAASSSSSQNSAIASTSKTSSSSKLPDEKTKNCNNTSQLDEMFPFPTEVYEMIFKELKGPHLQDLENVSNAIPEWRKLLKKERIFFLFPKVFHVLLMEGYTNFFRPVFYPLEDGEFSMYDLRLVCKSWNELIENYIQDNPMNLPTKAFNVERTRYWQMHDRYPAGVEIVMLMGLLEDTEQIEFMNRHQSTHSSEKHPFINRLVQFHRFQPREAVPEDYWNAIVNLLSTYGKHVHHFTVSFDHPMTPLKCIHLLRRMLSLFPNIKSLYIRCNPNQPRRITKREKRQIVRQIASGEAELPTLFSLEVVRTRDVPQVIWDHLYKRNGQVKEWHGIQMY